MNRDTYLKTIGLLPLTVVLIVGFVIVDFTVVKYLAKSPKSAVNPLGTPVLVQNPPAPIPATGFAPRPTPNPDTDPVELTESMDFFLPPVLDGLRCEKPFSGERTAQAWTSWCTLTFNVKATPRQKQVSSVLGEGMPVSARAFAAGLAFSVIRADGGVNVTVSVTTPAMMDKGEAETEIRHVVEMFERKIGEVTLPSPTHQRALSWQETTP
jgi:hypothetical protein